MAASPREGDRVYDLVHAVTLTPTSITIYLDLTSLVPGAPSLVHKVPITIARRGIEMRLVHNSNGSALAVIDPTLIKAIARGRRWFEEMLSKNISASELAKSEGVSAFYILRMLPLAFSA